MWGEAVQLFDEALSRKVVPEKELFDLMVYRAIILDDRDVAERYFTSLSLYFSHTVVNMLFPSNEK
jgi:hypothetical protein